MLEVHNLIFDYQDKPLLEKIHLSIYPGDLLHIKGGNGAGKTTLIKLIAGLHQPSSGDIRYNGQSVYKALADYQKNLCLVGHKSGINPHLSLRENCYFDLCFDDKRHSIKELLSIFNLEPYSNLPCSHLSSGQKRQIALMRLWMSKARIWLLDEPFVALDEASVKKLLVKIEEHRHLGGMVVLSSHQKSPLKAVSCKEFVL